MEFSGGKFIFPIHGLANCRTDQIGCDISVACSNPLLQAKLTFDGGITQDGTFIRGTASFIKFFDGCERVDYGVEAVAQPPQQSQP
jgi:hypothetical protein